MVTRSRAVSIYGQVAQGTAQRATGNSVTVTGCTRTHNADRYFAHVAHPRSLAPTMRRETRARVSATDDDIAYEMHHS